MCRLCWVLLVLLLMLAGGAAYRFLIVGSVQPGDDGRAAIRLDAGERDIVLAEMRAFLAAVQRITAAVGDDDMRAVAASARAVGSQAQAPVPATLVAKLPMEFKTLGLDTHRRFDQLALNAEQLGDPGQVLGEMAELMQNCVACHAAYRFEVAPRP